MAISIHYTSEEYGASATAYLKTERNDQRWATVKILDGYAEVICMFLNEQTVRHMALALAKVVAEFDTEVATEQAETDSETDNE